MANSAKLTQIAVAVVERDGQFLVGCRPAGVPLAGYAEFPGGKVKAAELAANAAARECLEETGVQAEVVELLARVQHEYEHGTLQLHFFACRVLRDAVPRGTFRWVSRDELRKLEFPPANRAVLELLCEVWVRLPRLLATINTNLVDFIRGYAVNESALARARNDSLRFANFTTPSEKLDR